MHSHGDILTKPFNGKISEHGQTDGKFKFSKLCCTKAHGGIRTIVAGEYLYSLFGSRGLSVAGLGHHGADFMTFCRYSPS